MSIACQSRLFNQFSGLQCRSNYSRRSLCLPSRRSPLRFLLLLLLLALLLARGLAWSLRPSTLRRSLRYACCADTSKSVTQNKTKQNKTKQNKTKQKLPRRTPIPLACPKNKEQARALCSQSGMHYPAYLCSDNTNSKRNTV